MEGGEEGRDQSAKRASFAASGQSYVGAGAKDSHHGYTFQFHLLMLYAMRALNLECRDFNLATEMADADKFDDIIFSYPKSKGIGRCYQFVQAKHTTTTKVIQVSQLLDKGNGPFSLRKYFDAYQKIKRNQRMIGAGDEIERVIICSNMGLKYGECFEGFRLQETSLKHCGVDDMLMNKILQFKGNFNGKKELILFLKNGCVSIPIHFALSILKHKTYVWDGKSSSSLGTSLCESYWKVLIQEVVDTNSKRFRSHFVIGHNLSATASHFRDELKSRYLASGDESLSMDDGGYQRFLEEREVFVSGEAVKQSDAPPFSAKNVAKRLTESLITNKDTKVVKLDGDNSGLRQHLDYLLDFVLISRGDGLRFYPGFIAHEWLPGMLFDFRESLKARLKNSGMDLADLMDYTFEIKNYSPPDITSRYCGDRLELDVQEFLGKLGFALEQPGIKEMEGNVKREISNCLNVVDASNAYAKYFNMMYSWAESKDARYMTEKDIREFFECQKKEITGCVSFNVRDPIVDFVGREEQLAKMNGLLGGTLTLNEKNRRFVPRSVVVCGLGGMGKSELVREYIRRNFLKVYHNVLWIDSENGEKIERSFKMLAFERLGIKDAAPNGKKKDIVTVVQETYHFFRGKKTLFVFDNAEVGDHLRKFFPSVSGDEGLYVIATSRFPDWRGFAVMRLENFSTDEALSFVRMSIGHMPTFKDDEARALAVDLSFFPLALKQAVSYIEEKDRSLKCLEKSFTISEYMDLLKIEVGKLLDFTFPEEIYNDYSETTFKTMGIALGHVRKSKSGKIAVSLLNVASYLSPDNIEIDILHSKYGRKEFEMALETLCKLSIISLEKSKARIHRLVQSVNRITLRNKNEEKDVLKETLTLSYFMDVEHIISAWGYAVDYADLVREFCSLPLQIMAELSNKSLNTVAVEFGEKALRLLTSTLGPDHRNTLLTRRGVARAFYFDGNFEEAAKRQKEILNDQKRVLGDNNEDVFETLYHYGVSIIQTGKFEEGLDVFKEIIDRGGPILGKDSDSIFSAKVQIVQVLQRMGRFEERDEYRREIESQSKKVVGKHKKLMKSKQNVLLENACANDEQLSKMLTVTKLARKKANLVGGVDVDHLAGANLSLAAKYEDSGEYEGALKHLKSTLELMKPKYDEYHSKTRTVNMRIARVLISMGKYDDALTILDSLMKYFHEKNLPPNDESFQVKSLIASALGKLGRHKESLKYYTEMMIYGDDLGGEFNETSFMDHVGFAFKLMKFEMYQESLQILKHVCSFLEKKTVFDSKMLNVVDVASGISLSFSENGYHNEALEGLKCSYHVVKGLVGESHTKTLEIKMLFASIYCKLGKKVALKKGLQYLSEVHAILCSRMHEDNFEVFRMLGGITKELYDMGQRELAVKLLVDSYEKGLAALGVSHDFVMLAEKMIENPALLNLQSFQDA